MDLSKVYFAFASGRLRYDCMSCGAKCCHGFGYEVHGSREVTTLLQTKPFIRLFLDPCSSDRNSYHVVNCAPGCYFLNQDGMCGVQVEHGYEAKPETCRLFPFNDFGQIGPYLIVSPHPFLCPLEVTPHGETSSFSDHAKLCQTMGLGLQTSVPIVRSSVSDVDALIHLERTLVALSETYLESADLKGFVAAQIQTTQELLGGPASDDAPNESVRRFYSACEQLIGADAIDGDEETRRTLIAITPMVRAQLLFSRQDRALCQALDVPLAVGGLYALALGAKKAGMERVTYQSVTRLFRAYRALITLLAKVNSVVMWNPEASIDVSLEGSEGAQRHYVRIVRALLPEKQRRLRRSLGSILLENSPSDIFERLVFLKLIAKRLLTDTVPSSTRPVGRLGVRAARAVVQRWVLARASEDLVVAAAVKGNAGRPRGCEGHETT